MHETLSKHVTANDRQNMLHVFSAQSGDCLLWVKIDLFGLYDIQMKTAVSHILVFYLLCFACLLSCPQKILCCRHLHCHLLQVSSLDLFLFLTEILVPKNRPKSHPVQKYKEVSYLLKRAHVSVILCSGY